MLGQDQSVWAQRWIEEEVLPPAGQRRGFWDSGGLGESRGEEGKLRLGGREGERAKVSWFGRWRLLLEPMLHFRLRRSAHCQPNSWW